MKEKDIPLNQNILDSMVYLHRKALFIPELHDKVLPLYERHNIEPTIYTYENLIQIYADLSETELVFATYDRLQELDLKPNPSILRIYLAEAFRSNHMNRVCEALETYEELKFFPPGRIINSLSKIVNPSDRLFVALKSMPKQYQKYREKMRTHRSPNYVTKQRKYPYRISRKRVHKNRRIKRKGF